MIANETTIHRKSIRRGCKKVWYRNQLISRSQIRDHYLTLRCYYNCCCKYKQKIIVDTVDFTYSIRFYNCIDHQHQNTYHNSIHNKYEHHIYNLKKNKFTKFSHDYGHYLLVPLIDRAEICHFSWFTLI